MESNLLTNISQQFVATVQSQKWLLWTIAAGLATFGISYWTTVSDERRRLKAAEESDPSLLRKHSTFQTYTTSSGHTYRKIRTFYKEHQQAEQLPKDLPLLVFTHGLGGSASQFAPLLTSLINQAPCLAIDFPGCGLSEFSPSDPNVYTTQALAELLAAAISRFRSAGENQKVALVGHSMGCSINAVLASSTSSLNHLLQDVIIGVIAICPRSAALTEKAARSVRTFTKIPIPLFNLIRAWDRRGGTTSKSVSRVVGEGAEEEARKLQLKYNEQSESGPFLRILRGSIGAQGMPGKDVWSGIEVPLFLVAGESDSITPAGEVERIASWLTAPHRTEDTEVADVPLKVPAIPTTSGDTAAAETNIKTHQPTTTPPRTNSGNIIKDDHISTKHSHALKTTIFPSPAAHGLMYATSTVRILSGMIENFLSQHIDKRLGIAWQMHTLTTSGKWDVKNLKKWQAVEACSEPIGGIFRAMKTMREVDDEHSPKQFVKLYSSKVIPDGVAAVLDISHEAPVYHPSGLEDAGVEYHKFPTVSKEKPRPEEVDHFIKIVDELRQSPKFKPDPKLAGGDTRQPTLGVHCHYGKQTDG